MPYQTILIILLLNLPFNGFGQQLVLVHKPFSESNVPNWRYSQDTVSFSTNTNIWGLIYLPNAALDSPQITLIINNIHGDKKSARFDLQPLDPSQLNWHKQIKKWYQYLLKSPHWYYFEITPNPAVVNAQDGVAFLEVFMNAAEKSRQKPALFTYHIEGDSNSNTCAIDFSSEQGFFEPLWEKLGRYQKIIANKKDIENQQNILLMKCEPAGFPQVTKWANETKGLQADLVESDLNIFQAVENIKIITEAIPDSISKTLKRELRNLLLLDLAILEMQNGSAKAQKIRQKTDLIKQLSLYPELKSILALYKDKTGLVFSSKQSEQEQEYKLQTISKAFLPYKSKYEEHVKLQAELDKLNAALVKFD